MRYIINAAVITGPGTYYYRLISAAEAAAWLKRAGWVSRISYAETAHHLELLSGVKVPLSHDPVTLQPGDEGLVVRLRIHDPNITPGPADYEYGMEMRLY